MIAGSGNILSLIMSGEAPSRASLAQAAGLSRATVAGAAGHRCSGPA